MCSVIWCSVNITPTWCLHWTTRSKHYMEEQIWHPLFCRVSVRILNKKCRICLIEHENPTIIASLHPWVYAHVIEQGVCCACVLCQAHNQGLMMASLLAHSVKCAKNKNVPLSFLLCKYLRASRSLLVFETSWAMEAKKARARRSRARRLARKVSSSSSAFWNEAYSAMTYSIFSIAALKRASVASHSNFDMMTTMTSLMTWLNDESDYKQTTLWYTVTCGVWRYLHKSSSMQPIVTNTAHELVLLWALVILVQFSCRHFSKDYLHLYFDKIMILL